MAAESTRIPPSIIAIAAGLAGSILTIAIGKALDLIQKRQEHKYSLQKAFFEKRLEVAEALVGNLRKAIDFLEASSAILRKTPDFVTTDKSREFLEVRMQALTSQAQTMVQQTKECYYAAPLYFDTEKLDRVGSLCNEKILNCFLMIGLLYKKLHAVGSDNPSKEDLEVIIHQFGELLKDIMATIESSKAAMVKFVHDFRDEMKEYKP